SIKEEVLKLESLRPGTQVMYEWAGWKQREGITLALRRVTLRKGEHSLVVFEYGRALCGVLKRTHTSRTRVRSFREWRQSFASVLNKLKSAGWKVQPEKEVSDATH
ncbi:MAG: hypothetical protein WC054_14530, partial [Candidatus Nanopelagicales bacterium]